MSHRFPEIVAPIFDLIGVVSFALCIFLAWQYYEQTQKFVAMETFFVRCMAGQTLIIDHTEAVRCFRY